MNDDHIKNNQTAQAAIESFLKNIQYPNQGTARELIFRTVSKIFVASGKTQFLYLAKLRRYWSEQDEFLARHAYPQNFSIERSFTITPQYLKALERSSTLSPDLLKILMSLENSVFTEKLFSKQLHQRLKRKITTSEKKTLLESATFSKETILHLMVYDGGFTHAIQFEMQNYLKKINQALSGFTVNRIECHVGDLGQKRQDQMWVGKLATNWELFIDPEFIGHCMPAFIQRFNYREATLIVYVSSETIKSQMKKPLSSSNLLNQLYRSYPDLRYFIQKIGYKVEQNMNYELIRTSSFIKGDSAYDPISSYERLKQLLEQYTSKSPDHQQEENSTPSSDNKSYFRKLSHEDRVHEVQNIFRRIKERS